MDTFKSKLLSGLFGLALVAGAQSGWSIVVGPNPGGGANPNPQTNLNFQGSVYTSLPSLQDAPNYELPNTVVELSNSGPYWVKNFVSDDGDGTSSPGDRPVIELGDYLIVKETLTIGGTEWWNDWHETLVVEGWGWISGAIYESGTTNLIDGLSYQLVKADPTDINFEVINFFFDTLQPGTVIDIVKILQFQGNFNTPSPNDNWGSDPITVREYPTQVDQPVIPEPATLGLLAVGSSLVGLTRWRRARRR